MIMAVDVPPVKIREHVHRGIVMVVRTITAVIMMPVMFAMRIVPRRVHSKHAHQMQPVHTVLHTHMVKSTMVGHVMHRPAHVL